MNRRNFAALAFAGLTALSLTGCSIGGSNYESPNYQEAGLGTSSKVLKDQTSSKAKLVPVDISGEEREVSISDDWRVCTQSAKPGESLSVEDDLVLGVVKADEECPTTGVVSSKELLGDSPSVDNGTNGEPGNNNGNGSNGDPGTNVPAPKDGITIPDQNVGKAVKPFAEALAAAGVTNIQYVDSKTFANVDYNPNSILCESWPKPGQVLEKNNELPMQIAVAPAGKSC